MKANTRKIIYLVCGLFAALIPIAAQTGLITVDQSDAWVTALASVAGGGAAIGAGAMVHRQQKEGLHDPPLNPVDQILTAIPAVLQQQQDANAQVDKLRQATTDLLIGSTQNIPMVGDTVGVVNDSVQSVLDDILGVPK